MAPRRRAAARSTGLARPHEAAAPDRSRSVTADETALAAVAAATGGAAPMEAVSPAGPVGPFVERAGQLPELGYWIRRSACTPELPLR